MTVFQIIFVPVCAGMAVWCFVRLFRTDVSRRNGLLWVFLWSMAAVLISQPSSTTSIARWFGISRGADLILYLATLTGMAACIYFYLKHRRLEILVTDLIRRGAIVDARQGAKSGRGPLSAANE